MFFDKFDVTTIQTKAHRHLHAVGYAVARLIAVPLAHSLMSAELGWFSAIGT